MCRSMVDIQSATAEIRRRKKKKERQKPQLQNIMSASATQGGHNNFKQTALRLLRDVSKNVLSRTRHGINYSITVRWSGTIATTEQRHLCHPPGSSRKRKAAYLAELSDARKACEKASCVIESLVLVGAHATRGERNEEKSAAGKKRCDMWASW